MSMNSQITKVLEKYRLSVIDSGRFYDIVFEDKKTGEKVNVPVVGELLSYGNVVMFTDGTTPSELTKQDWINLYNKK